MMIFEPVDGICALTNSPAIASRAGIRRAGRIHGAVTGSKPNLSLETWGEVDEEGQSIKPLGMPAESDWILYAPWTIDTAHDPQPVHLRGRATRPGTMRCGPGSWRSS